MENQQAHLISQCFGKIGAMTKSRIGFVLVVCVIMFLLSGCANGGNETPLPSTDTPVVASPPTEVNTPAPPPVDPGVIVLLWPEGADPAALSAIEGQLRTSAEGRGLVLETRSQLSLESQPPNLQMVVLGRPVQEVDQLVASMPAIPFLALGEFGLAPAQNLTVIRQSASSPIQAFLAGYIASVQSDEWRIGIISSSTAEGQQYREAFLKGVIYFCGTCTPFYPPYETYPQFVEVPIGSDQTAMESAVGQLLARGVTLVHVAPELQTDAFLTYLAQNGLRIIGTAAPPAGLESNWVASVLLSSQGSLSEDVLAVLDGNSLPEIGDQIEISYTGISEARLVHFQEILEKLDTGQIDPVGE